MKNLQFSYSYNKLRLNNYPFFDIVLTKNNRVLNNKYSHSYEYKKFETKEECWIDLLSSIKVKCNKYLKGDKSVFKIHHTEWCNNTGEGRYIHKGLWKNYQWIEGSYYITSYVAKAYAIRFDMHIPYSDIEKFHDKIITRHCNRFLTNFDKLVNTKINFNDRI